ncbi:hypothetical protein ACIPRI_08600 [Variovorax sp. LARHSF232]
MPIELWPPLSVIRSHLDPEAEPPGKEAVDAAGHAASAPTAEIDLALPLTELARRRLVLAARNFNARWAPGRIVSVLHEGRLLGVLLDKKLPGSSERWQGFMAASEADWASAYDVLLEPSDEPFEPLFGLIQAWNQVSLAPLPQQVARVQGEISATRLAAIRAVHDEYVNGTPLAIEPAPGHIALRSVGGGYFSVLSGTPLGPEDERAQYQQLYREAAARLSAATSRNGIGAGSTAPATPPGALAQAQPAAGGAEQQGLLGRLRRWFGADAWVRPALAMLALVVVVQNLALFGGTSESEDEVRFRAVPVEPAGASADLGVIWKPGVSVQDSIRLLRSIDADVVAGPDDKGTWYLRVPDVKESTTALSASPLVASVGPP